MTVEPLFSWQQQLSSHDDIFTWAMNVLAVTANGDRMFVARGKALLMFEVAPGGIDSEPSMILHGHRTHNITAISVGIVGSEEVVVSVDEGGVVVVYFTQNLSRPPIVIDNHVSTWGIALNGPKRRIAVSSNSHKIRVIDLGQEQPTADDDNDNNKQDEQPQQNRSWELIGHGHNIPCIDISSCGNFVVSASIDSSCRLWDLRTSKVKSRTITKSWGWAVRFLPSNSARLVSADTLAANNKILVPLSQFNQSSVVEGAFPRPAYEADDSAMHVDNEERNDDMNSEDDGADEEDEVEEENDDDDDEWGDPDDDEGMETGNQPQQDSSHLQQIRQHGQHLLRMLWGNQRDNASLEQEVLEQARRGATGDLAAESLLLFMTNHLIILMDCNTLTVMTVYKFSDFVHRGGLLAEARHRLCLHVYIPELSLLVIGSQGMSYIVLLELLRTEDSPGLFRYRLQPWPEQVSLLPNRCPHSILSGLDASVQRCANSSAIVGVRIFILYLSGEIFAFDVDAPRQHEPSSDLGGLMF